MKDAIGQEINEGDFLAVSWSGSVQIITSARKVWEDTVKVKVDGYEEYLDSNQVVNVDVNMDLVDGYKVAVTQGEHDDLLLARETLEGDSL